MEYAYAFAVGLSILGVVSIVIGIVNAFAVTSLRDTVTVTTSAILSQVSALQRGVGAGTIVVADENKLLRSVIDAIASGRSPVALAMAAQSRMTEATEATGARGNTAAASVALTPAPTSPAAPSAPPPPSSPRPSRGSRVGPAAEASTAPAPKAPVAAQKPPKDTPRPLPAVVPPPPRLAAPSRPATPPAAPSAEEATRPPAPPTSYSFSWAGNRSRRAPLTLPELRPLTADACRPNADEPAEDDLHARPTYVNPKMAAIPAKPVAPTLPPTSGYAASTTSPPPTLAEPDEGDRASADEYTSVWDPKRQLAASTTGVRLPFPELAGSQDETPPGNSRLTPTRHTPTQPSMRAVAPVPGSAPEIDPTRRRAVTLRAFVAPPASGEKGSA